MYRPHGTASVGATCPKHGKERCFLCDEGYELDGLDMCRCGNHRLLARYAQLVIAPGGDASIISARSVSIIIREKSLKVRRVGWCFFLLEISNDFSKRNKIVDSAGNSKKKRHKTSIPQTWVLVKRLLLDVSSLHNLVTLVTCNFFCSQSTVSRFLCDIHIFKIHQHANNFRMPTRAATCGVRPREFKGSRLAIFVCVDNDLKHIHVTCE